MRRSLLVAATTTALVLVASCVDDAAGPRQPMAGQLAVVPNFGTLQGGIVAIARGRFVLTRIPGGTVAADTVIDIAPGADSVDLAIQVPILTPGETFNLTIALISTTGDTVFRGGPVEVSPSTSGTPVPVEVPFTYVGTGANAAAVQILSPDTTTFTGESVLLAAEARDSAAAAIPNTPIGWTSLDTARVRVTADPQYRGVAVGGSQRGTARLVATLVTGQTDTVLVSNQPLPTTIAAESGNNQSALADSTLPQPLVARVTAGDGQGAAGLWVRFAVTTGAGTLSTDSALTDAAGRASVQFTIARSFRPHVITATTARLAGGSAVFNATLLFAPPATLEILAGDGQTATAGSAVAIAPQVRVLDADGLPIPGVTVTFSVTGGGGIVAGGTPITDTLGLATVTSWTLGGTAGPNALRAAVGGLTTTFSATGIAGAATRLVLVSGDAQTDTAGATLPLPLVARAEDANGNPVAGATVDWVAGAGGLNTATTVTDAGGLGQVTWTLGPLAGAQSVTATLNGTTATVGFSATATAGTAARLAFTVEPTDVAVNSIITPAVTVTASDGFGNVATGYTGSVQVSLLTNPGGGTLGGTTTRAAAAGVATFPDLSLNAFANGYALLATATGLTPDTSATFNVLGPAGQALWINPAGGNWSNPANWLGGVVPTASDTAFITIGGTYTVNVDAAVTVPRFYLGGTGSSPTLAVTSSVLTVTDSAFVETGATLSQTGAQVTGAGTVVVRGTFNWLGGTQSGTGQTVIAGTGALSLQSNTKVLDTRTLELAGTATWTGGGLSGSNGAIIGIRPGGLLDVQANLQLANGGGVAPTLDVQGTLRRSAGTGTFFLDWPLIDAGRLEVLTGTVEVRNSAALTVTDSVAAGATLLFSTGTATPSGGYAITGGGTVQVGSSGIFSIPTSETVTVPFFNQVSGTVTGAGTLLVTEAFTWSGGTQSGTGTTLVPDTATAALTTNTKILDARLLELAGAGTWTGGGLSGSNGAILRILTGGLLDVQANLQLANGGGVAPTLDVQGTLRRSAGTSTFFVDWPTAVSGALDVLTGSLQQRATFAFNTGAVLSGTGTLDLSNGAATVTAFDGTVLPGSSPGLLTIVGRAGLALGGNAVVGIELAGTAVAGTDFDQIKVTNQLLTLGGTLNVTLVSPYVPSGGESWPILTGVSGSFATVNLPPGVSDTVTINDTLFLGPPGPPGPGVNSWIPTSGNWSDPAKWSLARVPIPGDTVQLTTGLDYSITLDVDATIAKLTIGGTTDVISLNVGDQTLTITDAGAGPSLDILPLGNIEVGNGTVSANRISNNGSFRTTGTAAVVTAAVSNLTTWTVAGGQLTVSNPTPYDFQTSGTLRVESDATLTFDGTGLLTYLGGALTGGFGTSNLLSLINGAELGLQADLAYDTLGISLFNARIQGLQTTERLTIGRDGLLIMNGATLAEVTAFVENQGGIVATGGASNFLNDSLYVTLDGAVIVDGTAAPTTLTANGVDNEGTISLTGSQQTTFRITGAGGLTNRDAGIVATNGTGPFVIDGVLLNESGGTVDVFGPLTLQRTGLAAQHVNDGDVNVATGNLTVALDGTSPSFTNDGTITVTAPRSFSVSNATNGVFTNGVGGTINGTGTVNVTGGSPTVTNLGRIAPGLSPGLLTWQGNVAFGATSVLDFEVDGTTVGTGYDQLDAFGYQLTLGGSLNVTLGFQPVANDSFAILRGVRSGQFAAVNLPTAQGVVLDTGSTLTTYYVIAKAPPAPQILFAADSAGNAVNSGIFKVDGDGTNQVQVTTEGPPAELNVHPRWSPDRTRVTYSARQRGDPNQLHIRSADGQQVWHLTSLSDTSTFKPRYSPDGKHLAFECGNGGYPNSAQDVCVIADVTNPADGMGDGSGKVYVTDAVSSTLDGSGAFAWNPQNPDQLAIVRDSVLGGPVGSLIWIINYDGSGRAALGTKVILDGAGAPVQVYSMDWSSDGTFIAFEGVSGGTRSIFRIEVATGVVTQLTSQFQDHSPAISPDNSEILFGRESDLWILYKVAATGGGAIQMSPNMNFDLDQAGWDWSPDGTEIVVTEDVTTNGVVISKILPTTTPTSFFSDANAVPVGRRGGVEIQDRQPSWRP